MSQFKLQTWLTITLLKAIAQNSVLEDMVIESRTSTTPMGTNLLGRLRF